MPLNAVYRLRSSFLLVIFSFPMLFLQAQKWSEVTATGDFPARSNASAIYNSNDHSVVVFGGKTGDGFANDLWRLDLDTYEWTEIIASSDNKPFPRHTADALFDATGNRMLIYSGQGTEGLANDVWSFDLSTLEWTELNPNSSDDGQPSKRYGTISVLDESTNKIVTFAGFASVGNRQDDTWAFSLSNNTWQELGPDPHPLRRCLHRGTLVSDQRKMIAYGGQNGPPLEDIWAYDLDANTWTELTPDDSPPGRLWSSINYIGDNRLIVFGGNGQGQGNSSGVLNDLWEFTLNDNTWKELTLSDGPEARDGHIGLFLPCAGEVLVFAGSNVNGDLLNDVWKIEGLVQNNAPTLNVSATFCEGEAFEFAGMSFETGGNYSIMLQTAAGCDSTVFLSLTELQHIQVQIDTSVAPGSLIGEVRISADTSWTISFPAASGCDSIVTYNAAILTTSIDREMEKAAQVQLSPNPFSTTARLRLQSFVPSVRTLTIYSANGRFLRSHRFTTDQFVLQRSELPQGLYYFRVHDQNGQIGVGKFVVK